VRIIYFSRDFTAHDHRFLTALAGTTHEVLFLRLERQSTQREERALPEGIVEIPWLGGKEPFAYRHSIRLMKDLSNVIQTYQPELIHAGPIQTCAFLTAQCGFSPLVSMSWGSDLLQDADQNAHLTWVTQYTLDRTKVLIGDCEAVANKAQSFGFPREKMKLFPWGVDLNLFQPGNSSTLRSELGWQDNPVFLSLRAWEPIYGVDVLIQGFAEALKIDNSLRLLLLGGGSQQEEIQEIITKYQLAPYIYLAGYVQNQELVQYYQAADIYLSCSFSDGSSVSLMEALACGLPALVSDIPGNLEWIVPGEQGWLFKTGSPASLGKAMLTVLANRQNWLKMGQTARQTAESRADWQKNFQCLLQAYDQALQLKTTTQSDGK
jgi:glycosyltransferase involved in cell wall biosynthesis